MSSLPTLGERFLSKVSLGQCWHWRGAITGGAHGGYGSFRVGARTTPAHRYAWETFHGPIPDGLVIDHLCRTRSCVNPNHMEVVTRRENTLRGDDAPAGINARKEVCQNGHSLEDDNLRIEQGRREGLVRRRCATCYRDYQREYQRRRREAARG